ncbi:MAG: TIGR02757 family protein [Desulfobacterales bacterium]|nr:TIGR02757 family protein [Desulfobacterales bacterium]
MAKQRKISLKVLGQRLERIYQAYNARAYVDPDPLYFLYDYSHPMDREVVGLIAASLAYGRVEMIMKTVGAVLEKMGPSPSRWLAESSPASIEAAFSGFVYRFARGGHLSALLLGMKAVQEKWGSMENCFVRGMAARDKTILPGLVHLTRELDPENRTGHLLADPSKASACKRSHLFLRWMVRCDPVDPGGWEQVDSAGLVIPLDTHMFKVGTFLDFTDKKSPGRTAALEISQGFRKISPRDPVKYDFALSRFGIRRNMDMDDLKRFLTQKNTELEL